MAKIDKEILEAPIVSSVIALHEAFSKLTRVSSKIENQQIKSDADFEHMQRLMAQFGESGQAMADGIVAMAQALADAQVHAEAAGKIVTARAEQFQIEQQQRQKKMEAFRLLSEKVIGLNHSLTDLKGNTGSDPEDRHKIAQRLAELQPQLHPLIDEADQLKNEALNGNMTGLAENVHSMKQSLMSLSKKLETFQSPS